MLDKTTRFPTDKYMKKKKEEIIIICKENHETKEEKKGENPSQIE